MLINPLYLDTNALAGYIASVEEGLRQSGSSRMKGTGGIDAAVTIPGLTAGGQKGSETESTYNVNDHDSSRLMRLITAGRADPERYAWIEVAQSDIDLAQAGTGALIDWECEIFVPEGLAQLSGDDFQAAMRVMQTMSEHAQAFDLDLDTDGLPDAKQLNAVTGFLEGVDIAPVVVGESYDGDGWKVAGSLDKRFVTTGSTFDGPARIAGKVKRRIEAGRYYPLLSLPGMSALPREERRRQERQGPTSDEDKGMFLEGPLLIVDFLAIYT